MAKEKNYSNKIITIPNILSLFRLCLIPLIIWIYCARPFESDFYNSLLTVAVYCISGITDIVDGVIARKFNMISSVGKVLDPVADKLTQIAVIVCLITRYWYMSIPLAIFVAKEVGMGIVALVAAERAHTIKGAKWHGKVNTVVFFLLMAIHLVWEGIPATVSYAFVTVCVIMMLISATLYTIDYFRMLKQVRLQNTK